jgi:hypothetical protein
MRRRNVIFAIGAVAIMLGTAAANTFITSCNCSVYLSSDAESAIVIENTKGWVDEPLIVTSHSNDRAPTLGMRPHHGVFDDMRDCSRDGFACVDLKWQRVKLAFKPGNVGESYAVDGVTFTIHRVGRIPHRKDARIFVVHFAGAKQLGSFVYSETDGVLTITDDCINIWAALSGRETCKSGGGYRYQLQLADGPGLLSAHGYPAAREK